MKTSERTEERQEELERQADSRTMLMFTGGLTREGDSFLIACGAVLATVLLYPLVGPWSLLAFPVVFFVVVVGRSQLRKRR